MDRLCLGLRDLGFEKRCWHLDSDGAFVFIVGSEGGESIGTLQVPTITGSREDESFIYSMLRVRITLRVTILRRALQPKRQAMERRVRHQQVRAIDSFGLTMERIFCKDGHVLIYSCHRCIDRSAWLAVCESSRARTVGS